MKNYKKMMGLALTGVLSLFLLTACGDKKADPTPTPEVENTTPVETTLKTVQEGKLTLSTNAEFPPYEMTTDAGGFEGIDVEAHISCVEHTIRLVHFPRKNAKKV